MESTAWLVVLLGSLAFMFLLLSSVMFYYRRRKAATCASSGYLPAAVTDLDFQHKCPGVLWSERHWETCDSERESTASHKRLLQTSPSLATEYSYADPGQVAGRAGCSVAGKQSFESPYATSNVIYDPERKIKVISTFYSSTVLPFLLTVKSPRMINYSLSASLRSSLHSIPGLRHHARAPGDPAHAQGTKVETPSEIEKRESEF